MASPFLLQAHISYTYASTSVPPIMQHEWTSAQRQPNTAPSCVGLRWIIFTSEPQAATPPKNLLLRGDVCRFLVLLSCFSLSLDFPQVSVFYESGSHLLPAVCHTHIPLTRLSKLQRRRSGRNFPPGVVISVSWICSCCSHNFSELCVFTAEFFHLGDIHVCCSPVELWIPLLCSFVLVSSVSHLLSGVHISSVCFVVELKKLLICF